MIRLPHALLPIPLLVTLSSACGESGPRSSSAPPPEDQSGPTDPSPTDPSPTDPSPTDPATSEDAAAARAAFEAVRTAYEDRGMRFRSSPWQPTAAEYRVLAERMTVLLPDVAARSTFVKIVEPTLEPYSIYRNGSQELVLGLADGLEEARRYLVAFDSARKLEAQLDGTVIDSPMGRAADLDAALAYLKEIDIVALLRNRSFVARLTVSGSLQFIEPSNKLYVMRGDKTALPELLARLDRRFALRDTLGLPIVDETGEYLTGFDEMIARLERLKTQLIALKPLIDKIVVHPVSYQPDIVYDQGERALRMANGISEDEIEEFLATMAIQRELEESYGFTIVVPSLAAGRRGAAYLYEEGLEALAGVRQELAAAASKIARITFAGSGASAYDAATRTLTVAVQNDAASLRTLLAGL